MAHGIKTVRDELDEVARRIRDIVDLSEQEGRDLTEPERTEVAALDRRGRLLQAKLPQAESLPSLLAHVPPAGAPSASWSRGDSIGESFVRSGAFQAVAANLPTASPWIRANSRSQAVCITIRTGGSGSLSCRGRSFHVSGTAVGCPHRSQLATLKASGVSAASSSGVIVASSAARDS